MEQEADILDMLEKKVMSMGKKKDSYSEERRHLDIILDRLWGNSDFQTFVQIVKEGIRLSIEDLKREIMPYDFHKDSIRTAFLRGEINALESKIRLVEEAGQRIKKASEADLKKGI